MSKLSVRYPGANSVAGCCTCSVCAFGCCAKSRRRSSIAGGAGAWGSRHRVASPAASVMAGPDVDYTEVLIPSAGWRRLGCSNPPLFELTVEYGYALVGGPLDQLRCPRP